MVNKRIPRRRLWLAGALRLAIRSVARLSPSLAAAWAYGYWFYSPRYPEPAREQNYRRAAREIRHRGPVGPLRLYLWGEGPRVLLVHGWSGRGPQLGALVSPLLQRGFSVLAFDAPGHGRSAGHGTNAFMVTDIITRLAADYGPLHALVGHSFGAVCVVMALARGVPACCAVSLSSPTRLPWLQENYFRDLRLSPAVITAFQARQQREFGGDAQRQASADELAAVLRVPALIVHDRDDRVVAAAQSELLARAWPGSRLLLTRRLGHLRLLRDPQVIAEVSEFIARAGRPPSDGE